jgi:hypothetical protein
MRALRGLVGSIAAVVVVLLGTWVTGGLLTDDARTAMVLTGLWFTVTSALALVAVVRRRRAALPVAGATILTVAALGGWLLFTSQVDHVVKEQVLAEPTLSAAASPAAERAPEVTRIATGSFTSGAHETKGKASLLRRADSRLVLTLVGFSTAPGPDLRVRLAPAGAAGVNGAKDLGALKGNKGDQQYAVPVDAPTGRVVIWCRAFSVVFGTADLQR